MPKAMWSYQCDYCGGLFKSYKFCEKHEVACIKNPEGKSCMYCEYGWSKKERKKNNNVCPKSGRRYCKQISANCEHFIRIDRKQKFREVHEYYKSLEENKNGESESSFDW